MSGRGRANATLSGLLTRIPGRSGRIWEPHTVQLRPGHLRSSGAAAVRATRLVKDEDADAYGALRVFPNRRQRGRAAALLAAGNPVMPALLDIVDHPGLPPALVTAWSPGASSTPLHALRERDDLDTMLAAGHRWSPAGALHTLVPLGRALDDMARAGFTPLELSPDHLVLNSGSLAFVGLGRHGYIPSEGRMPGPQGMSLPSALLLGEDLPPAGGSHDTAVRWREVQVRALTRLAGWMACGLPPAAWGPVHGPADLGGYLEAAGFQRVPALRPGQLADTLARAAGQEEEARALRDFAEAEALLVYDDAAQGSGGGRLDINPEVLRLGLLHDHGAKVIALAAFEQRRLGTRTATLLSGAGWVLLSPKDFAAQVCRAASAAPGPGWSSPAGWTPRTSGGSRRYAAGAPSASIRTTSRAPYRASRAAPPISCRTSPTATWTPTPPTSSGASAARRCAGAPSRRAGPWHSAAPPTSCSPASAASSWTR